MGKLRTNSTDDFPVESRSDGISYILIHSEENGERYTHYKPTKTEKTRLLRRLEECEDFEDVSLLGVWTGKWSTDTHELELPRFFERMQEADL